MQHNPTGFKSHFVLAVEAKKFLHPRDYAQAYAQELVAQIEQKQRRGKSTKQSRSRKGVQAPQEHTTDNDNSTVEPAMAENETTDSSHAPVEVVEELSPGEEADLQRLELKVEKGIEQVEQTFYEIGQALAELRSRRLYRSTHRRWSDYCNERFHRIKRRRADYFILASEVIDDLNRHNCACFPLPTSESQVRSMKNLSPTERIEVWQTGVIESGGEVPTAKTIKGIVKRRLKERDTAPPPIPYHEGDVFVIRCQSGELKKYSGFWAIATQINEYTVSVHIHNGDLVVKPESLEPIDSPSECEEVRVIAARITRLRQCELSDQSADAVLTSLGQQTHLTKVAEGLLSFLEKYYGID